MSKPLGLCGDGSEYERGLAGTRNAGDGTEHAKRDVDVDPFMCFCRLSLSLERTEDCKRTMRPW